MPKIKPSVARVIKYGPWVAQAIKHGQEPVQKAAAAAMDNRSNRKKALAHADTVQDGTVLPAFDHGRRLWVVFSGHSAVEVYPPAEKPLAELLEYLDLSRRQTTDAVREQHRLRVLSRARDTARRQLPPRRL